MTANAPYINSATEVAMCLFLPIWPLADWNLAAQMIHSGEFKCKEEARQMIYDSFDIKVYEKEGR